MPRIDPKAALPRHAVARCATAATLGGCLGLGGCGTALMTPGGPVGGAEKLILLDSLAIMLAIIVPTILATLAFAFWFRSGNRRAKRLPDWAFSGRLELVIWAIPLLTILFLGGLTWTSSHRLDPARPLASKAPPVEVQVVSLDWKWLFIYPQLGVASVNTLTLPAGTPVHFSLTSASVMDSFFVPRLGSQIYTMNGMTTQLNLQADRPGVYQGLSTHFSGDGFPGMHFAVNAVPPERFAAWVAAARASGPQLTRASYDQLAKQSSNVAPYTYSSAQPGLFEAVVTQSIAPAPGPDMSRPHQDVSPKTTER